MATVLAGAARGPARSIFPHPDGAADDERLAESTLVVMTMVGLPMPDDGGDPTTWSSENRAALAVLHLAAYYARRFVYLRPPSERKVLGDDEIHRMTQWQSGAAQFRSYVRMVRGRNLAVYAATQHPLDLRNLDPQGEAFTGGGWIGRQTKRVTARQSLEVLGQAPEDDLIDTILDLCNVPGHREPLSGEFLHVDAYGDLGVMRVDLTPFPELATALRTTPGEPG